MSTRSLRSPSARPETMRCANAVVVGSQFGAAVHIPALRMAGISVSAVVGRDQARTSRIAESLGVPLGTISLDEAIERSAVDLVIVATPAATHGDFVRRAIEAGKHVLCEKPFTTDVAEARQLLDAAQLAGVQHFVGTQFRFASGQAVMSASVRQGHIGEAIFGAFTFMIPLRISQWTYPAAFLIAHAPHVIDRIRTTLGEIAAVSANLHPGGHTYTIEFRTVGGTMGLIQASAAAWGEPVISTRIIGGIGTVWDEGGDRVWLADPSPARELSPPEEFGEELEPQDQREYPVYDNGVGKNIEFVPCVRLFRTIRAEVEKRPDPYGIAAPTFADGLAHMQVLAAAETAHREQRWVDVA
jgi:predicted dehydrogenase